MKRIIRLFFLWILLAGCSLPKTPPDKTSLSNILPDPSSLTRPLSDIHSLPRTLSDTKPVALMPFYSAATTSKYIGQEAADRVALELLAKGYFVIDRSTTTALVNEAKFYGSGLSDDMRNALQVHNIAAVVFGSVNDFSCETVRTLSQSASLINDMDKKNRCTVSLTAKITDTASGRLIWGVTLNDTSEGNNLTAIELMKSLIRKADMRETLPEPIDVGTKPR